MDTGLVAWTLVVSSMVLLMAPGRAMSYGGMARSNGAASGVVAGSPATEVASA